MITNVSLSGSGASGPVTADVRPTKLVFLGGSLPQVYSFASLGPHDLDGMQLDVPDNVTLCLPSAIYAPLKNVDVERHTYIWWNDIQCGYYLRPKHQVQRDKSQFLGVGHLRQQILTPIDPTTQLVYRQIANAGSDSFASSGPTTNDIHSYVFAPGSPLNTFYGGFISVRRGETYSACLQSNGNGGTSCGSVGVMFRHTGGYSVFCSDPVNPSTAKIQRYVKAVGAAVSIFQDVDFPGRGSYTSYNPANAVWGVTIVDRDKAIITINGRAITTPVWNSALGDIIEVGFVWMPTGSTSSGGFFDPMIERNTDPLGRPEIPEIRIFGDSTSDYLLGMWQDDLRDILDHTFGVKFTVATNYAVSGTNSSDVVASITSNGLGSASYVIVGIGTNDIQQGVALATSTSNLANIINSIKTAGRVPVMVLPYMWYTQAQVIAGRGQASTNYDQGAPLRAKLARLCADLGAIMVDPTRELPEPKPSYVTGDTTQDPLVRDNIHQTALGYKLYAWAIARAIASYHAQIAGTRDYFCSFASEWMQNGWSRGSAVGIWQNDQGRTWLQGNLAAGAKTSGTLVMTLPRWARPSIQQAFVCSSDGGFIQLVVSTNGAVTLGIVPAGFTIVDLNTVSFASS